MIYQTKHFNQKMCPLEYLKADSYKYCHLISKELYDCKKKLQTFLEHTRLKMLPIYSESLVGQGQI